jgi:hypothetical protein
LTCFVPSFRAAFFLPKFLQNLLTFNFQRSPLPDGRLINCPVNFCIPAQCQETVCPALLEFAGKATHFNTILIYKLSGTPNANFNGLFSSRRRPSSNLTSTQIDEDKILSESHLSAFKSAVVGAPSKFQGATPTRDANPPSLMAAQLGIGSPSALYNMMQVSMGPFI